MPWFLTRLVDPVNGHEYGSHMWANNRRHARVVARRRGLGETIEGEIGNKTWETKPHEYLRRRSLTPKTRLKAAHAALFLSHLAIRSGVLDPKEALCDGSVVHEIIHGLLHGSPRRKTLIEMALTLERKVPGFLKPGTV